MKNLKVDRWALSLKQIWLYEIYGTLLICQNTKLQRGYMEHELKDVAFYIQKHIAHRPICYNFLLVRDTPLGAPAFVKLVDKYLIC